MAGVNRDTIKSCFTKVNAAASIQVGGIVGNLIDGGYIKNCYSRGQISGTSELGGIAGRNYKGKIKYCYSTSPVNSHYSSGGIVGDNNSGTIQNSFWDTETSGQNSSAGGGTGLSTSEMQNLYNYDNAGWNFVNIWGFNPAENDGYPFLRWEGFSNDISVLIVETTEVDDIDVSSASIRGFLIGLGNSNPTAYGVCWNKTGTPTINNDTTSLGSTDTTGSFMTHLSDLEVNTTYFVRTYATNNDTTVYGDEFSFTTLTYELEVGGNFYADDKIYDGTTHLDSVENNLYLSGIVGDDDVKIDTLITQFNDSIAGKDKVVKITNLSLSGNDTAKYHVSMDDLPVDSADIHPKELIVKDAKVNDKVYDGTTDANITGGSLNGIISVDNVKLGDRSGSFASADAGSNIEVISKMTIKGENAMNYKITQPEYLTGDIIPKETALEGSFKVENKEYDGTKEATISENNLKLEGIIANDQVSLANVNASFAQAEEGTDITVSINSVELEGSNAGNYSVALTDAPTTKADITDATGINSAAKASIKLYPNPFQDYIMIESEREIKKVEIAAMSGITRIIENPENRINTSKLEKGVYLIILEDAQGNRYQSTMIRK